MRDAATALAGLDGASLCKRVGGEGLFVKVNHVLCHVTSTCNGPRRIGLLFALSATAYAQRWIGPDRRRCARGRAA